jgi:hypothetical protein
MLFLVNMKENFLLKLNTYNMFIGRLAVLFIGLICVATINLYAQNIDFGQYEGSSVTVSGERDLTFGDLFKGEVLNIALGSGLEGVISLNGIRYMDAFVEISPFPLDYLYLDGDDGCVSVTCRMALSVSTSYTNSGQLLDNVTGAIGFTGATARFPIRNRPPGPPRPPPVPPHAGYTPPTSTSYIYFYGSITSDSGNAAGSYWTTITVTVTYN